MKGLCSAQLSESLSIVIRQACESDLLGLISLIEAHAEYEKTSLGVVGLASKIEQAMQGDQPRLRIYVAEANSTLVGIVR